MPFLFFLLALVVTALAFVFGVHVVLWNVVDIAANGANFWNIFWLMLVAVIFLGGASKAAN
jgi:hypothetical protein